MARDFTLELLKTNEVAIKIACKTLDEAEELYDDLSSSAKTGKLRLDFDLGKAEHFGLKE